MGCASSVPAEAAEAPKEIASSKPGAKLTFGRDPNLKKEDYMVKNQDGAIVTRPPGTINGQQFLIADCKNCTILLLDQSEQTTIDRCDNCIVLVAACSTSVFARKCTGCTFAFGAKQLRFREVRDCAVLAACHSRPVIEDSSGMRFGCWRLWYSALEAQMAAAGIDVWANKWNSVYDFGGGASTGASAWTALDSAQEVELASKIAAAAPHSLATSTELRVVTGWSTWCAPPASGSGGLTGLQAAGAADSTAPLHHGRPTEAPSASTGTLREGLSEPVSDTAVQASEQVAIGTVPAVTPPSTDSAATSAGPPESNAAAPPSVPQSVAATDSGVDASADRSAWKPCVPLTAPLGGPTACFLLLLPGSQWPDSAFSILAAVSSGQGSDTAGLGVMRCRPFAASATQLAMLGVQPEAADAATGKKCLGVQLQWVDAADEGADASTVLQAVLPESVSADSFAACVGQTAADAVQHWFVDWEDEFNK